MNNKVVYNGCIKIFPSVIIKEAYPNGFNNLLKQIRICCTSSNDSDRRDTQCEILLNVDPSKIFQNESCNFDF